MEREVYVWEEEEYSVLKFTVVLTEAKKKIMANVSKS